MEISSPQNPRIKHVTKLHESRRQRERDGVTLVEGLEEIKMALSGGYHLQLLLTCPDLARRPLDGVDVETLKLSGSVFRSVSYRENPDGWLAVLQTPRLGIEDLKLRKQPLLMVVEGVEKPGNLGAILRTVDSAGVEAVLVCDPRVDLYGPNVIRASRGAIFTVPTIRVSSQPCIEFLRKHRIRVVAATPDAGSSYTDTDLRGSLALVVGTEHKGLTDRWLAAADTRVRIPMVGKVNSLNVSVATAIILYEALRQRRH